MGHMSDVDHGTLVAWAAGTVAAHANCTIAEAIALMEARAV